MNTVIKRISEIEDAASSVMESANISKKAFAEKMEEQIREFDQDLERSTSQGIEELRIRLNLETDRRLEQQKSDAEKSLQEMEDNYKQNYDWYIEKLFRMLTEE